MLLDKDIAQATFWRLVVFTAAVTVAISLLSSCLISPLYISTGNDVLYASSPLPEILSGLVSLADTFFASIQYAAVILSFLLFASRRQRMLTRLLCVGTTLFARMLNQIAGALFDGTKLTSGITGTLLNTALELAELYIAALIASLIFREAVRRYTLLTSAAKRLGNRDYDWTREVIPYRRVFAGDNPVQKSALISALIFSLALILSRVIYDINLGAPSGIAEIIQMIIGYTSDIAGGIIMYALILLICYRAIKPHQIRAETTTTAEQ